MVCGQNMPMILLRNFRWKTSSCSISADNPQHLSTVQENRTMQLLRIFSLVCLLYIFDLQRGLRVGLTAVMWCLLVIPLLLGLWLLGSLQLLVRWWKSGRQPWCLFVAPLWFGDRCTLRPDGCGCNSLGDLCAGSREELYHQHSQDPEEL